jgi:cobalt transporter subunit CbtA
MPRMIPATPTAFLVTNNLVNPFRKLMFVVLCSGTLAGLVLFAMQHFTVVPLIEAAERYEKDADRHPTGWKPDLGWERTGWTVVTTVLTSIGFAGVLFGFLSLTGRSVSMRQGVEWGLAAFACFHLAPSLGLPPLPPGVPVADVQQRQVWWMAAVVATAVGLWLMSSRSWRRRIAGIVCIAMPHVIGAPVAVGERTLPAELLRNFAIASLATTAIFWPLLGAIGGFLSRHAAADS